MIAYTARSRPAPMPAAAALAADDGRYKRRHRRGQLRRRRIRRLDPLGQGERRPGQLAHRQRLQDSRRRRGRARQLHQAEHALLRRQGEPRAHDSCSATAICGRCRCATTRAKFMLPLRLGTVNANGPQDLIIYALTQERPRRDRELPHREAAVRHRRAALRQGRLRQFLQGDVRSRGRSARTCARCSSNMPGTWAGAIPAPPIR